MAPKRSEAPLRAESPADMRILGLTRVETKGDSGKKLEVFLELRNSSGEQLRTPARFLFEMYKYQPRSSEPAGQRLQIWDPVEVTRDDLAGGGGYWLTFLEAYSFELDLGGYAGRVGDYLLQVTCFTADGRRLTDTLRLKNP
ncbi:hypothetical protein [Anaerohalosphaera lusitana]|uniref:hypothetical protein n=1 Tax=Anaerohalosphaera lusitana TaxID=1936003 RepID=UPI0011BA4F37|nr:hypothetical protein [Anaerohalosphaera lusitana]